MKKVFSRVVCFTITLICILSAFPIISSASYDIDSTYVMDDLEKLSDFDLSKYTKNENEQYVSLIAFHEYGYDYNKNFSDYGLYVYLYNPSGKPIYTASGNKISMKLGNAYKNYDLNLVSFSVESGYEHVFYKFKVKTDAEFVRSLLSSRRVYDINGIKIHYKADETGSWCYNKYSFAYTGCDSYHGVDRNSNKSTLECQTNLEETVSLELHGASWKTDTSDKGTNHQYEISSVYFAVPNYFLKKYGSEEDLYKGLYGLTAEWYEYKTNGLITNNQTLYNAAFPLENYVDSDLSSVDKNIPFNFHVEHGYYEEERCTFNQKKGSSIHDKLASESGWLYPDYDARIMGIPKLCNVLFSSYDEFEGFSSEETKSHLLNSDGSVNSFLFVDDGRIAGYNKFSFTVEDGPLNTQIKNYAATHKGKFWHDFRDWLDSDYDNPFNDPGVTDPIDTFYKVSASDFSGGTNSTNAYKLFVSEADYVKLKSFYNSIDKSEYTVYLLRFAVTDYVCGNADVDPIIGSADYGSDNYYFEKTVFLNFDVLDMSFRDEWNNVVTLPVEAEPIDIIGTITPPPTEDDPDPEPKWWEQLLAYLQFILIIVCFAVVMYIVFNVWDRVSAVLKDVGNKNNRK